MEFNQTRPRLRLWPGPHGLPYCPVGHILTGEAAPRLWNESDEYHWSGDKLDQSPSDKTEQNIHWKQRVYFRWTFVSSYNAQEVSLTQHLVISYTELTRKLSFSDLYASLLDTLLCQMQAFHASFLPFWICMLLWWTHCFASNANLSCKLFFS